MIALESMWSSKVNWKGSAGNRKVIRALVSALEQAAETEISKFTWSLWSHILACKINKSLTDRACMRNSCCPSSFLHPWSLSLTGQDTLAFPGCSFRIFLTEELQATTSNQRVSRLTCQVGARWSWHCFYYKSPLGTTDDEVVGWHHRLNGHEFEQALGQGEGQGSLACCSPWGLKESDRTEWVNNNKFCLDVSHTWLISHMWLRQYHFIPRALWEFPYWFPCFWSCRLHHPIITRRNSQNIFNLCDFR